MTNQTRYVTDNKLDICMDRVTDDEYQKIKSIRSVFEVVEYEGVHSLCGNVRVSFNVKTCKATLNPVEFGNKDFISSYEQISSALALYRSISLFKTGLNKNHADFYKLNWMIVVKHKESGEQLGLGEWKGGFQIFTKANKYGDLPKSFVDDVEMFLTFLVSPNMPIGYDGTVAGTVA